ncbi:MAG: nucleotidyltransferase domain-containing protein [Acidimicrobiales bacterium]|jgi:predicted nucleotidyltransferase
MYDLKVDLSDPTRALTPTLDGPVLAVLAAAGRPLTVGQIAVQAARGSEIGIRRSVARLVREGLVTATVVGRNQVHELNRDHVAAPAATLFADLRLEVWRRLREAIQNWDPRPLYACAFGSAARGDGGEDSDIDLLLVHPQLVGESPPLLNHRKGLNAVLDVLAAGTMTPNRAADGSKWQSQMDELHRQVLRWTGNQLHVVDISPWQWISQPKDNPALHAEIRRDAVDLCGSGMYPALAAAR